MHLCGKWERREREYLSGRFEMGEMDDKEREREERVTATLNFR